MSSGMQEINPLDWAFDPLTEAIVEISIIEPQNIAVSISMMDFRSNFRTDEWLEVQFGLLSCMNPT